MSTVTKTPVAADARPSRGALISPDSGEKKQKQKQKQTAAASSPSLNTNPAQTSPAKPQTSSAPTPTPSRTLSAQEQLSRLREKLRATGFKPGQTPIQPAQVGSWKPSPAQPKPFEEATAKQAVPIADKPAATPAPVADTPPAAIQQPVDAAAKEQEMSRASAAPKSTEVAMETAEASQPSEVVEKSDNSQKRDATEVEHAEDVPLPKKTKHNDSNGSATVLSTTATASLTAAQKEAALVDEPAKDLQAVQASREAEEKRAAQVAAGVANTATAVEDKLKAAAERRQQMENERRAKEQSTQQQAVPTSDQSKKRCVPAVYCAIISIYACASSDCVALHYCCRPHPEEADAAQKRPKALSPVSSSAASSSENRTVGTDKVLMPPPPPSASKKTPLKSPSTSSNSNSATTYTTEMKPYDKPHMHAALLFTSAHVLSAGYRVPTIC